MQKGEEESVDPFVAGERACQYTSSTASINVWASRPVRPPTISVALPPEKIASTRDTSSPSGTVWLIKCCKACSPESRKQDGPGVGEGGATSSLRDESSAGESDPLSCLSHSGHVSRLSWIGRKKTLTWATLNRVVSGGWCAKTRKTTYRDGNGRRRFRNVGHLHVPFSFADRMGIVQPQIPPKRLGIFGHCGPAIADVEDP